MDFSKLTSDEMNAALDALSDDARAFVSLHFDRACDWAVYIVDEHGNVAGVSGVQIDRQISSLSRIAHYALETARKRAASQN